MTIKKISLLLTLGLGATQLSVAVAVPPGCGFTDPCINQTNSPTTKGDDVGYGGLKWTMGAGLIPEIVAGYRHAEVASNGDTQGADISIAFKVNPALPLSEIIQPGKLRAKYFNGIDFLQGEMGGGYDFAKKGAFVGIGAQGPYVNAGVDYNLSTNSPFSTFLMFNSLGIYNRPHRTTTTLTCAPNRVLDANNQCIDPNPG